MMLLLVVLLRWKRFNFSGRGDGRLWSDYIVFHHEDVNDGGGKMNHNSRKIA